MAVNSGVIYSEPGAQPATATGSVQVLAAANPVARLFARVINGAFLFTISLLFWLATFIGIGVVVAGDFVAQLWPLVNELAIGEVTDAGPAIEEAVAEYWASYSVGAATMDVAIALLAPLGAALLAFVLRILYLCLMYRFFGSDFGHLILGLRVVNYGDGRRPSFGQALGRALLKQFDGTGILWLVNGVMVLVAPERRHMYDLAANTMVIRAGGTAWSAPQTQPTGQPTDTPQLTGNRAIPLPPPRS